MISCGARLAPFDIKELWELMERDDLELDTLGDRKTALTVQRTDPETAVALIRKYHYSKVLPRLTHHYSRIYRGGQLYGVVLVNGF